MKLELWIGCEVHINSSLASAHLGGCLWEPAQPYMEVLCSAATFDTVVYRLALWVSLGLLPYSWSHILRWGMNTIQMCPEPSAVSASLAPCCWLAPGPSWPSFVSSVPLLPLGLRELTLAPTSPRIRLCGVLSFRLTFQISLSLGTCLSVSSYWVPTESSWPYSLATHTCSRE